MEYDAKEPFYVGRWLIQPRQNRIRGPEKVTRVEPKVMEVLMCLARRPGEVVTRDQLLEIVWAGVIETIPKTGYRLIAPLTADYRGDHVPPAVPTLELAPSMPPSVERSPVRWPVWAIGGILVLLLLSALFWTPRTTPTAFHPTPLTSYPGGEGAPVLSPDGKQVAFAWTGPEGDNWDVYLKLIGSETPLRLTDDPAMEHEPAWSPDASQVAFMRRSQEGCWIYLVAALGAARPASSPRAAKASTATSRGRPTGRGLLSTTKPRRRTPSA